MMGDSFHKELREKKSNTAKDFISVNRVCRTRNIYFVLVAANSILLAQVDANYNNRYDYERCENDENDNLIDESREMGHCKKTKMIITLY